MVDEEGAVQYLYVIARDMQKRKLQERQKQSMEAMQKTLREDHQKQALDNLKRNLEADKKQAVDEPGLALEE